MRVRRSIIYRDLWEFGGVECLRESNVVAVMCSPVVLLPRSVPDRAAMAVYTNSLKEPSRNYSFSTMEPSASADLDSSRVQSSKPFTRAAIAR